MKGEGEGEGVRAHLVVWRVALLRIWHVDVVERGRCGGRGCKGREAAEGVRDQIHRRSLATNRRGGSSGRVGNGTRGEERVVGGGTGGAGGRGKGEGVAAKTGA